MQEKREINRIDYSARSVIVLCDTHDKYFVEVKNVSPLGMGITAPAETPEIVGKDIIIVTETLIMYADVIRQTKNEDGSYEIGINARKFTDEILAYLFEKINIGE